MKHIIHDEIGAVMGTYESETAIAHWPGLTTVTLTQIPDATWTDIQANPTTYTYNAETKTLKKHEQLPYTDNKNGEI